MLSSQGQTLEPNRELWSLADTTGAVALSAGCWAPNLTCRITGSCFSPPFALGWHSQHLAQCFNCTRVPELWKEPPCERPICVRSAQERRCHPKQLLNQTLLMNRDHHSVGAKKDLVVPDLKKPNPALRWALLCTKLSSKEAASELCSCQTTQTPCFPP